MLESSKCLCLCSCFSYLNSAAHSVIPVFFSRNCCCFRFSLDVPCDEQSEQEKKNNGNSNNDKAAAFFPRNSPKSNCIFQAVHCFGTAAHANSTLVYKLNVWFLFAIFAVITDSIVLDTSYECDSWYSFFYFLYSFFPLLFNVKFLMYARSCAYFVFLFFF